MKELYKSLAAFQQEVPIIHKGTKSYGYSYADLPAIFEAINPILKKNGLGFTQPVISNTIKTIVFHAETGDSIESTIELKDGVSLKGMNDFQILGSQITYLRRYALSSILGLVTDKDTDGNGEQDKQTKKTTPAKPELKRTDSKGNLSANYIKIVDAARGKGFKVNDLKKHYTFDKETELLLNKELDN